MPHMMIPMSRGLEIWHLSFVLRIVTHRVHDPDKEGEDGQDDDDDEDRRDGHGWRLVIASFDAVGKELS